MYDIKTASLDAAIDLSIMATKICALPEDNRERIIALMAQEQNAFVESMGIGNARYPLFEQYMDLMQDHGAPDELKIAAFLYLTRSQRSQGKKGEGEHEAGNVGQGTVIVERALAR